MIKSLFQLYLDGEPLEIVTSERLLGLQVDQCLTLKFQKEKVSHSQQTDYPGNRR